MKKTINYKEIMKWVEKYSGTPSVIDYPEGEADKPGVRIDFYGTSDDELLSSRAVRNATWDEFIIIFDDQKLVFVYEESPDMETDPSEWYRFEKR